MKKVITLFSLSIGLLMTTSLQAKIWRVNNTGAAADFTTIQGAHDDPFVLAGDTLHIESSAATYGNLTSYKKLIILGAGYFLAENYPVQANTAPSKIDNLTLYGGSEGTILSGITVTQYTLLGAGNLSVIRNHFIGPVYIPNDVGLSFSNVLISQNYFSTYISSSGSGPYAVSNITISNNAMMAILLLSNYSGTISNNVIYGFGATAVEVDNFVIKNNIFYDGGGISGSGNGIFYNMSSCVSCLPAGNGNQNSISMTDVFIGSGSTDGKYQLKPSSLATGAGESGADCGMFGGIDPYRLSGIPAIPSIYILNAPVNSNGDLLPINISIKSNN